MLRCSRPLRTAWVAGVISGAVVPSTLVYEGKCTFPFDEPQEFKCPVCRRTPPRPRHHPDHTYELGECRWAGRDFRKTGTRNRDARCPREARPSASEDPTADLRARNSMEGQEPAPVPQAEAVPHRLVPVHLAVAASTLHRLHLPFLQDLKGRHAIPTEIEDNSLRC